MIAIKIIEVSIDERNPPSLSFFEITNPDIAPHKRKTKREVGFILPSGSLKNERAALAISETATSAANEKQTPHRIFTNLLLSIPLPLRLFIKNLRIRLLNPIRRFFILLLTFAFLCRSFNLGSSYLCGSLLSLLL